MPEDFEDSAIRHWKDAVVLENALELDNADQLYGFAAECAIKAALVTFPGYLAGSTLEERYRKHIDELWDLVGLQSLQKRYPTLLAALRTGNSFADWRTSQRYSSTGSVAKGTLEAHKRAARRVIGSVGLLGRT